MKLYHMFTGDLGVNTYFWSMKTIAPPSSIRARTARPCSLSPKSTVLK